jgi:hypothetical protein
MQTTDLAERPPPPAGLRVSWLVKGGFLPFLQDPAPPSHAKQ